MPVGKGGRPGNKNPDAPNSEGSQRRQDWTGLDGWMEDDEAGPVWRAVRVRCDAVRRDTVTWASSGGPVKSGQVGAGQTVRKSGQCRIRRWLVALSKRTSSWR